MAQPITKAVYKITSASEIPFVLEEAYQTAVGGRPGPVLIDIPMNVQREAVNPTVATSTEGHIAMTDSAMQAQVFGDIIALVEKSAKPLIIAGGGIRASNALKEFKAVIDRTKIPVVTSLLGLDVLPFEQKERVGFLGSYGNRWANLAIGEADLLIVLGSRLDIRQTGADTAFFSEKKIIHVDIEQGEINNRVKNCYGINEDLVIFLDSFLAYLSDHNIALNVSHDWLEDIQTLKSQWPDVNELAEIEGINPNQFMHDLSREADNVGAWIADVGNHQMWAAQSLEIKSHQRFLTSGGMGAMGFALPAAIGAALALNQAVVMIAGDGGFQLNLQELQTVFRNKLPVKMVVINNNSLGMIRQFQDSYFDSRYQSTFWGYSAPDFERVATAYGIDSQTITNSDDIDQAIKWFLEDDQPKLLQVKIDIRANAYPKIAFGKPITDMEPFSKPIAMEAT